MHGQLSPLKPAGQIQYNDSPEVKSASAHAWYGSGQSMDKRSTCTGIIWANFRGQLCYKQQQRQAPTCYEVCYNI